jgi:hypothetical protein
MTPARQLAKIMNALRSPGLSGMRVAARQARMVGRTGRAAGSRPKAERDDICAVGQTAAAHDLCTGLRPSSVQLPGFRKMMGDLFLPTDKVVLDQNALVIKIADKLALFETGMRAR